MHPKVWLSIFLLAVSTWGLPLRPAADTKPPEMAPDTEVGMASFYGARFHRLRESV